MSEREVIFLSLVFVITAGIALFGVTLFAESAGERFHLGRRRLVGLTMMAAAAMIFVAAVTVLS